MANTYTWINRHNKVSTTETITIPDPNPHGAGFFFVGRNADGTIRGHTTSTTGQIGVAGRLLINTNTPTLATADVVYQGSGIFVRTDANDTTPLAVGNAVYISSNALASSDNTGTPANAVVVEAGVNLILPDGTSLAGVRIDFNSTI